MKKFTIQSSVLRTALNRLQQAVSERAVMPVLEFVKASINDNRITLTATNLDLTILYKADCQSEDPFEMLLPFADMRRLTSLERGTLEVGLNDEKAVTVKMEEDYFNLGIPPEMIEFPKIEKIPADNSFEIPDGSIFEYLNVALATASKDGIKATNVAMNNVLIHFNGTNLTIASTNGSCLFSKKIQLEKELPETFLQLSPKAVLATSEMATAKLSWNKNVIAFQSDFMVVMTKQALDKFPNYRSVIPDLNWNGSAFRYEVESAIQKCLVITRDMPRVALSPQRSSLVFESLEVDLGKSTRVGIDGTYHGEVEKIALSGPLLQTLLKQLPEDVEEIAFSVTAPNRAVLIKPKEDDSLLLLIAPMHLN